jgi:hypothetical protein
VSGEQESTAPYIDTRHRTSRRPYRRYLEVFSRPLSVLQVCQQIRNEALPLFYGNNTLDVTMPEIGNNFEPIKAWFKRLSEDSRHVRNVRLEVHVVDYRISNPGAYFGRRLTFTINISIEKDTVKLTASHKEDFNSPYWIASETYTRAMNEVLHQCIPSRPRRARKRVSGLGVDDWVFLLSKLGTLLQHFTERKIQKWHQAVLTEHERVLST